MPNPPQDVTECEVERESAQGRVDQPHSETETMLQLFRAIAVFQQKGEKDGSEEGGAGATQ
jgi:hypothetical protein